mmetsp:Transcript_25583/g.48438  ORF Transcript_25583/g.48438 Transcript_25583/m.48438 type:complete len:422 (+) Transcript_25583:189-1454(+)
MGVVGRPRGISRLLEIAFAVLAGAILGIWTMSILTPADRTRVHFPIPTQEKGEQTAPPDRQEVAKKLVEVAAEAVKLLADPHHQSASQPSTATPVEPSVHAGVSPSKQNQQGGPYPNLVDLGQDPSLFLPGSLDLPRAEVFKKCYVSPVYYKEHFYPTSQICSVSHADRLMYLNVPKSGSSTSRTVFAAGFGAVDNQMCGPGKPSWSTHKKVSIVRDPLTRFYAGYDEAFARVLSELSEGRAPVADWLEVVWKGVRSYKEYERIFDTPETLRRFEAFVHTWEGRTVFNDHIRLQSPALADSASGLAHPMDYIGETRSMVQAWDAIGALVGKKVEHSLSSMRGRSYPRRFNTSQVSFDAQRRICRLAAIDYCCLNFPLPAACQPTNAPPGQQVYCQWVQRDDVPDPRTGSKVSGSFIEPYIG